MSIVDDLIADLKTETVECVVLCVDVNETYGYYWRDLA